jgi:hypothetical protein
MCCGVAWVGFYREIGRKVGEKWGNKTVEKVTAKSQSSNNSKRMQVPKDALFLFTLFLGQSSISLKYFITSF